MCIYNIFLPKKINKKELLNGLNEKLILKFIIQLCLVLCNYPKLILLFVCLYLRLQEFLLEDNSIIVFFASLMPLYDILIDLFSGNF
jgi:hypothetical protein